MAARPDLLSTMAEMPSDVPEREETARGNLIIRNPDGTITLRPKGTFGDFREISHEIDDDDPEGWNENLADALSPQERMTIADELIEYAEIDIQVREQHFLRLKEGMELLGITDIPRDSIAFTGASTVTHPLIAEACVQFQARAMEELFPPQGPVKPYIVGKATQERIEQGERLAGYMNYQLTEEDEEYYWNTDQLLFYLPMAGSAFKKVYIDPITGMTTSRFVPCEDFIVPYTAKSLRTASRYAHRFEMTGNDVRRAQEEGDFLEDARLVESPNVMLALDNTRRTEIQDLADDRRMVVHEDDTIYSFLEYHIDYRMPWDDEDEIAPPYIITVETESREVVSVRRNWKQKDPLKRKRIWFVHYKYLPGLGFYGFGLLHIIGSLARAVSGGIRALLDSAIVANLQGGFRSKELNASGEMRFVPGIWQPVDATIEELEKGFFNIPAKEPSTALATLVSTLVEEGRRFATVTENMVGDADNRGPVGTTLALIEQGSKVFSGIHKRCHKAAREEFKLMATLNYEFMEVDEYPYEVQGEERSVLKSDFDGRVDVIPVSDPNIWSQTQRIALAQAALELIMADPTLYSRKKKLIAHKRMLEALRYPNVEEIVDEENQKRTDPVTENMDFMVGSPGKVFPEQDHAAHIAIHMNFAQHQAAENAELYKNVDPVIQAHIMEHRAYLYRQEIEQQLGIMLPQIDLQDDEEREELPIEIENMIAMAVAQRLRPPPDPAATEENERAQQILSEAQAKEQAADLKAIGTLQRMLTEHAQKLKLEADEHAAEQRRLDEAHRAEQRRLDQELRADLRRDDAEHRVDLRHKQQSAEQDIEHAQKKFKATFGGASKKAKKKRAKR